MRGLENIPQNQASKALKNVLPPQKESLQKHTRNNDLH